MPQQSPIIELPFPVGGLSRRAAFQDQPPYTTPLCLNVRPFDVVNLASAALKGMRQRGGARPGVSKVFNGGSASLGGAIQLLDYCAVIGSLAIQNTLVAIANGVFTYNAAGTMTAPSPTLPFQATNVGMRGSQVGQYYYIADYRPVTYQNLNTFNTTVSVAAHSGSSQTLTDSAAAFPTGGSAFDTMYDFIWVSGANASQSNIFPITGNTGTTITYNCGTSGINALTAQTNRVIYQVGRMPKVFDPSAKTITNLMGALPIPYNFYSTGTIGSASGVVTLSGGTFPTLTADQLAAGVTLTIPNTSGIGTQSYLVASQASGTSITLTDTTTDADCSGVVAPNWQLTWVSSIYGVPPLGCPLCCTYRGRLVLAGPGPVWYMSRILAPTDWNYGADPNDPSRAVAGTSATAGGIPDNILALIPHSDSYLIFGCERSLWILTADPGYGGQIQALSREVGCLGPSAWCNIPDGTTAILSRDGLYLIPAGGGVPSPLSRQNLPAELLDLDWQANTISMSYDVQARGIHLSITLNAGGTDGIHYFLDLPTQSFWPVLFTAAGDNSEIQPAAMVRYASSSSQDSVVVYGCLDGYLRSYFPMYNTATITISSGVVTLNTGSVPADGGFPNNSTGTTLTVGGVNYAVASQQSTTQVTLANLGVNVGSASAYSLWGFDDDGTAFVSFVAYGPFRFAGPGMYGQILGLQGDLDVNGRSVAWNIYQGLTAEAAVAAIAADTSFSAAPWSGTWKAGLNPTQRPRATGAALPLVLVGASGWAVEGVRVEAIEAGPIR